VSAALSDLAEACLAETVAIVRPGVFRRFGEPETPLAVLGLGKLGGREMSYSSDLDLIFLFGDEDAPVLSPQGGGRGVTAFEVMSRLAQRILHGLGAILPSGRLYTVDTRLRPSGEQGTLVSSLEGFERYHDKQAALWERQALIKARTVAGDAALGARVEAIARRHVWEGPPLDPHKAAQEIGRLRARLERELANETAGRFNIKVGRGGLLDVEFLVQYLQLVHGPHLPLLRHRATRPALEALRAAGVLDDATFGVLATGYRFLRRLENRMRIVHDRSISQLGDDPLELDKLARRLGYRQAAGGGGDPSVAVGARLLDEYRRHTARVRAIYARWLPAPG
jgi:glutamate-ammonia-ligase adenylyltransferase